MGKMTLLDGKFYQDDKEIPLEFGNKNQIALINEAEQRSNDLNGDGLDIDYGYRIIFRIYFDLQCICGHTVNFNFEIDDDGSNDFDTLDLVGKKKSCKNCGRTYITGPSKWGVNVRIDGN